MLFNHIHDALDQVRELRGRILEGGMFRGYSGLARMAGGSAALAGAFLMSRGFFPREAAAHVAGWGTVCAVALAVNYGAVINWYLAHDPAERELGLLRPTIDALPPLAAGAVLTVALLRAALYSLLFGSWMLLFGLVNLSSRRSLPRYIGYVGWYYIICGTWLLVRQEQFVFTDPWPMGLVFFCGEILAGLVLIKNSKRTSERR